MSREILRSDDALFDAIDIAYFIGESSLEKSNRFLDALNETYEQIAEMPYIGVSRDFENPVFAGMRIWAVPSFSKYLIFYRVTETTIEIVRILHSSSDVARVFQREE